MGPVNGKLKPEVIAALNKSCFGVNMLGWPSRSAFKEFIDSQKNAPGFSTTREQFLRKGKVVPWIFIEILAQILGVVGGDIGDPTEEAATAVEPAENFWKLGWGGLFLQLTRAFSVPDEAICKNEADVELAARLSVEFIGRNSSPKGEKSLANKENNLLSTREAIAKGEEKINFSLGAFTAWLLSCWKFDRNTVMFAAVKNKNGDYQRAGVTGVIPLTKVAYQRFRSGLVEPPDFSIVDFEFPSDHLLVCAAFEVSLKEFRNRTAIGEAQWSGLMTQFARLGLSSKKRSIQPKIITLVGSEQNEQRALAYSFKSNGFFTPHSGHKIMEFKKPSLSLKTFSETIHYEVMCSLFQMYFRIDSKRQQLLNNEG